MHKSTLKALAAVTDKDRPGLSGIRFQYSEDSVKLESADGAMLIQIREQINRDEDHPPDGSTFLIDAESALKAVKFCSGNKDNANRIVLVPNTVPDNAPVFICDGDINVPARTVDAEYPNTARVWPDPEAETVTITFNAKRLKQLCNIAISQEKFNPTVKLDILGPEEAAVFELNKSAGDTTATGLIMPCRG